MADNLEDVGPQDAKLIALEQPHEVAWWTKSLGCSRERLREAVAAVGHRARAVRAWLADHPEG